jgi:hypothetical protein
LQPQFDPLYWLCSYGCQISTYMRACKVTETMTSAVQLRLVRSQNKFMRICLVIRTGQLRKMLSVPLIGCLISIWQWEKTLYVCYTKYRILILQIYNYILNAGLGGRWKIHIYIYKFLLLLLCDTGGNGYPIAEGEA